MTQKELIQALRQKAKTWRKDSEAYSRQVDEARKAGTPYQGMLSLAQALKNCAKDLDATLDAYGATATSVGASGKRTATDATGQPLS